MAKRKAASKPAGGNLRSLRSAAVGAKREARKYCALAFKTSRERQRELDADGIRREISGCEDLTRSARALVEEYTGKKPKPTELQLKRREHQRARSAERVEFIGRDAVAAVRDQLGRGGADVDDEVIWRAVRAAIRKTPARDRRHDRVAEIALDSLRQGRLDAASRGKQAARGLDRYARDAELSEAHERIAQLEASIEELRGAGKRALRRAGERIAARATKKRKPSDRCSSRHDGLRCDKGPGHVGGHSAVPAAGGRVVFWTDTPKRTRRAPVAPTTVIVIDDDDVPF